MNAVQILTELENRNKRSDVDNALHDFRIALEDYEHEVASLLACRAPGHDPDECYACTTSDDVARSLAELRRTHDRVQDVVEIIAGPANRWI